jgi:hypothetical protein
VFNYLIRVKLPDRPGALGAVASRIGSVGGDVVSIEILQRTDGLVVDELGVGLAADTLIDLLRDEILEVDGVTIESIRSVEGAMPDRSAELLDVAAELFKQSSPTGLMKHLTARVRRSLDATFAAVLDRDAPAIVACDGEPTDPEGLVDRVAALLDGDGDADDLALAPLDRGRMVLAVGRIHPVLRDRERRWIVTMAELADYGWRDLR